MSKQIKKEAKEFYICPHCKKKQYKIITHEYPYYEYEYDINTQNYTEIHSEATNDVSYYCPECNEQLEYNEVIDQFI